METIQNHIGDKYKLDGLTLLSHGGFYTNNGLHLEICETLPQENFEKYLERTENSPREVDLLLYASSPWCDCLESAALNGDEETGLTEELEMTDVLADHGRIKDLYKEQPTTTSGYVNLLWHVVKMTPLSVRQWTEILPKQWVGEHVKDRLSKIEEMKQTYLQFQEEIETSLSPQSGFHPTRRVLTHKWAINDQKHLQAIYLLHPESDLVLIPITFGQHYFPNGVKNHPELGVEIVVDENTPQVLEIFEGLIKNQRNTERNYLETYQVAKALTE